MRWWYKSIAEQSCSQIIQIVALPSQEIQFSVDLSKNSTCHSLFVKIKVKVELEIFYIIALFRTVISGNHTCPRPFTLPVKQSSTQAHLSTHSKTPFKTTKGHIKSPDIVTASSLHLQSRPIPHQILEQFPSIFQHSPRFTQASHMEHHLGAENHTMYTNKPKIPQGCPRIHPKCILETTFSGFQSYKPFVLLSNRLSIQWSRTVRRQPYVLQDY